MFQRNILLPSSAVAWRYRSLEQFPPNRLFGISAEGLIFIAAWIETEVMKWWGDSVQKSSFGVYPIPYPTGTGCLLAHNTPLILYILQFLTCVTVCVGHLQVSILFRTCAGLEIIMLNVYFVLCEGLRFIPFPIPLFFVKIACTPHKLFF